MSAGAVVDASVGYIDVKFLVQGYDGWTEGQSAAVENLQLYSNYFGTFYVLGENKNMTIALTTKNSSGEYLGNYGYFLNTAPYEIILSFANDDWSWYTDIIIPAGTERIPGEFKLTLDLFTNPFKDNTECLFLYSAEVNKPVASTEKTNTSEFRFYAKFPDGSTKLTHTVTPPSGHVGLYSFKYSDVQNYVAPTFDGYVLKNDSQVPSIFYISPDGDSEYVFEYGYEIGSTRTIHLKYLDEWSNVLYTETIYLPLTLLTYTLSGYQHYKCFPGAIYVDTNSIEQTFSIWCLDTGAMLDTARENGYQQGLKDAYLGYETELKYHFDLGYKEGYDEGLSQNGLTQKQTAELRREYNAFTALFDGIFSGVINFFNTLGDGIAIGGVSLKNVISTVLVAVLISFAVKMIV